MAMRFGGWRPPKKCWWQRKRKEGFNCSAMRKSLLWRERRRCRLKKWREKIVKAERRRPHQKYRGSLFSLSPEAAAMREGTDNPTKLLRVFVLFRGDGPPCWIERQTWPAHTTRPKVIKSLPNCPLAREMTSQWREEDITAGVYSTFYGSGARKTKFVKIEAQKKNCWKKKRFVRAGLRIEWSSRSIYPYCKFKTLLHTDICIMTSAEEEDLYLNDISNEIAQSVDRVLYVHAYC